MCASSSGLTSIAEHRPCNALDCAALRQVAYIYDVAGRDTGGRERTANDFNDPWILHSDAFGVSVQNASKM